MEIAALVTWILTALGGAYMLTTWVGKGGHRQPSSSHFPPALIFGHFALAATGLVVWIVYVVADTEALKWVALVILLLVALLGFTMLARWIPTYRTHASEPADATPVGSIPAEGHFPVAVVFGHGLLAVVTLVLVLLTVLEVGAS
jgi:hypothetical protein